MSSTRVGAWAVVMTEVSLRHAHLTVVQGGAGNAHQQHNISGLVDTCLAANCG